jgi:hypothetical protein
MTAARRAQAGSATAELIVVMPLLLLILTATIEVGRFADYAIKLGNAARAGVQFGAQNISNASQAAAIQSAARADAQNPSLNVTPTLYCICADGSASQCLQGDCPTSHRLAYVQVVVSGKVDSLTNFALLPAALRSLTIQRSALMRVAGE